MCPKIVSSDRIRYLVPTLSLRNSDSNTFCLANISENLNLAERGKGCGEARGERREARGETGGRYGYLKSGVK
jgi:hypothetical protein